MHPFSRSALALAVSLMAAVPAAQASIFVDLRPRVTGLATAPGHAGWMAADSLQWGAGVDISPAGQVGRTSLSELVWTQRGDSILPALTATALAGTIMPTTRFDLVGPAGAATGRPYLSIGANNTALTGVSQASGGGEISVSASLGYSRFAMTSDPAGLGKTGPAVTTSYDLVTRQITGFGTRLPAAVPSGQAAAPGLYMRLGSGGPGGQISGEVTANGYLNWINLSSYQFGVGLSYDPIRGMVSRPSVSEVTVTQPFDATLTAVFANLLRGSALGQVTLELVTQGAAGPVTTMQLALNDVRFSGLSLSSGGELPSLSESLNFTSFSQTAWALRPDGTRGAPSSFSYDLQTGQSGQGMLASSVAGFGSGNLSVTAVPEPQSWALMLAGVAGLFAIARRRNVTSRD